MPDFIFNTAKLAIIVICSAVFSNSTSALVAAADEQPTEKPAGHPEGSWVFSTTYSLPSFNASLMGTPFIGAAAGTTVSQPLLLSSEGQLPEGQELRRAVRETDEWPVVRNGSGIQLTVFQKSITFSGADRSKPVNSADPAIHARTVAEESAVGGGNVTYLSAIPVSSATIFTQHGNATGLIMPASDSPGTNIPPAVTAATTPVLPAAGVAQTETQTVKPAVTVTSTAVEASDKPRLTLEVISQRQLLAEQTPGLTEEVRAQIAKHWQRATELLTQKNDADRKHAELKAERDNGPASIAEYRAMLTQPPPKPEPDCPPAATVAELEQARLLDDEKLADARRSLEGWETKSKYRAERRLQLPSMIETTRKQLEDALKSASAAAPEGELPVVGIARQTEQEAQILQLNALLSLYRIEQSRYEALNEWFPLQRDVLTRTRNAMEKRAELWKTVLAEARREESARQAREARRKLRNAHPTLRDLAEHNSTLTLRRKELQEFQQQKDGELSSVSTTLQTVEKKFRDVVEKEKRAGLTTAIGLLLRSHRSHLPDTAQFRQLAQAAEQDIVRLQSEQMQFQDERNILGDIQDQVDATLSQLAAEETSNDELRQMTFELLSDRRQYLDDLLEDYDSCLQTLAESDVSCRRLESIIREYESYIDERVLWIRSAAAIDLGFAKRTWTAALNFASHRQWKLLSAFVLNDLRTYWLLYVLFMIIPGLIVGLNRRTRRLISRLGETAQKNPDSGIPLTLLATGLTIITASAWPALLWFAGWRIADAGLSLASALSDALLFCAAALLLVDSFRRMCRRDGVAECFLDWPQAIVRSLHSNLLLYVACGVPLTFVVVAAEKLDEGASADSVGRLSFVCLCLLLSIVLRKFVRPAGPVIGDFLRANPNSLMFRLRWLWYPLAVGSPLLLAALAVMGYQYTAEQLMIRLQLMLGLSLLLSISYTMVMQWMLAARRKLAMQQARARRAAALAAAQREAEDDGVTASAIPPIETPQVDLSLLNQQMLRLVRGTACILFLTVSWWIWAQVLPALQVVSRFEVWDGAVETIVEIDPAIDGTATREVTRIKRVTLGHLLFSLIVLSAAVVASRNLPGLLELAVLQRLPMDQGGRYAVTTLCRYAFMLAGMIVVCNSIGIGWGSVQWLVAALTVGLGFGLQEIFANFVSGLIILFERPVRIGDLVTIDGVSGCVSRIQIRATTIMDWDRKEYIVPNKEFVTGKLLNWTLSDKVNRIVINVGVAYGTDTEKAMALLHQIADENPLVLKEPAPALGFEGFGDSCLNLVLRCFLSSFENRLSVITQLHVAIDRRFREEGIEIAFPQRHLHIRTLPPQFAAAALAGQLTAEDTAPAAQGADEQDDHRELKRSA